MLNAQHIALLVAHLSDKIIVSLLCSTQNCICKWFELSREREKWSSHPKCVQQRRQPLTDQDQTKQLKCPEFIEKVECQPQSHNNNKNQDKQSNCLTAKAENIEKTNSVQCWNRFLRKFKCEAVKRWTMDKSRTPQWKQRRKQQIVIKIRSQRNFSIHTNIVGKEKQVVRQSTLICIYVAPRHGHKKIWVTFAKYNQLYVVR